MTVLEFLKTSSAEGIAEASMINPSLTDAFNIGAGAYFDDIKECYSINCRYLELGDPYDGYSWMDYCQCDSECPHGIDRDEIVKNR